MLVNLTTDDLQSLAAQVSFFTTPRTESVKSAVRLRLSVGKEEIGFSGCMFTLRDTPFLATARHCCDGIEFDSISVRTLETNNGWKPVHVIRQHLSVNNADLAVFRLNDEARQLDLPNFDGVVFSATGLTLGAPVYAIGFPSTTLPEIQGEIEGFTRPLGFVRTLRVGMIQSGESTRFWMDGHNSKGYSGSPVFANCWHSGEIRSQFVGIISARLTESLDGENAGLTTIGIALGYESRHILDSIQASFD